ncbi:endonuclease/exonuclease/phosphatase family protein [Rufibacter roseus]|uniref:Endonuclease/exonuclease/phosphatase family protein n=1 Tax=Rufibacter roseus TaxID=1567108 RepID=A0ABW2DIF6_9BACT|nr:endonuclease/exonuclease/phosphatase family protein [Rufibacter roseus]
MSRLLLSLFLFASILAVSCDKSDTTDPVPEEKKDITSLKVMSYNIHYGNPPTRPGVTDIEAIVNVVNGDKPDLLALQEVDVNTTRSGRINMAQAIASRLHMRYYFAKAIDYQGGEYGVALLSKYPLSEAKVHRLPTKSGTGGEPRILATAKISLPDGTFIRFGNTHLDAQSDHTNRLLQIEEIARVTTSETLPFIIAGDFNAVPGTEVINKLDAHFQRTCQNCAPTIPASAPTRAIDFIAYRHPANKFSVESHKVIYETYASDHRPVVAVLNIGK